MHPNGLCVRAAQRTQTAQSEQQGLEKVFGEGRNQKFPLARSAPHMGKLADPARRTNGRFERDGRLGRRQDGWALRPPVILGAVCNWFVKRILRQKAADARRKYEPVPPIGECF